MRKRRRKIIFWLAPVLVTGLALYVYHWRCHHALLQYEAELRARGERLSWAELDFHPSTNAEDIRFRRDFASTKFPEPEHWPALRAWIAPGVARVSWQQDTNWELDSDQHKEIVATNWEEMQREADNMADALATFREILKHPGAYYGPNTNAPAYPNPLLDEDVDKEVRKLNWLHRAFSEALVADLHRNQRESALSNLVALIEIVQVNRNEPTALGFRVSCAVTALDATWEWLQAPGWTDQELSTVQSLWDNTDLTGSMLAWVVLERAQAIDGVTAIREADASDRVSLLFFDDIDADAHPWRRTLTRDALVPAYMAFAFDNDVLFTLKYDEDELETVRRYGPGVAWPPIGKILLQNRTAAFTRLRNRAEYRKSFSVFQVASDPFPGLYDKVMETEAERRMTVTAIALRRYHDADGQYPASLASLVPQYLVKVPLDPMTGTELSYRLKPDGMFLLYSAGADGHDDGGDATPVTESDPPSLWDGRDAVWPAVATTTQIAAELARRATNKPTGEIW